MGLGTRLGFSGSHRGTASLPGIVLRERLRVPWVVGAARLGYRLGSRTSLELGYTIGSVGVSIEDPASEGMPLFPVNAGGIVNTLTLRPRIGLARLGIAAIGHAFAGPALVWRTGECKRSVPSDPTS